MLGVPEESSSTYNLSKKGCGSNVDVKGQYFTIDVSS